MRLYLPIVSWRLFGLFGFVLGFWILILVILGVGVLVGVGVRVDLHSYF